MNTRKCLEVANPSVSNNKQEKVESPICIYFNIFVYKLNHKYISYAHKESKELNVNHFKVITYLSQWLKNPKDHLNHLPLNPTLFPVLRYVFF